MTRAISIVLLFISSLALAQTSEPQTAPRPPRVARGQRDVFFFRGVGPGPMGRWWKNAEVVQKLGLSDAQLQRVEQVFQEHRMQLIDLHANLERAEATLEPLIEAENSDEAAVMAQIDKVAGQRAELEKANARMLFAIRRVLTPEQWKKLQLIQPPAPVRFNIPVPPPGGAGVVVGPGAPNE